MRLLNALKRFRQYLRRGRQSQRPQRLQSRPRLEELESRMLLSTMYIDGSYNATYTGNSALFGDNLTMSFQTKSTPFVLLAERSFTDTVDTINVTGPGAGYATGSGTHTVTLFAPFGVGSTKVFTNAFSTVVTVQSNDVGIYARENSGSYLYVNLGNSTNGVQSILAPVGIDQQFNTNTDVTVDDSHNGVKTTDATFNGGYLTGLAPAAIHVGGSSAGSLNLNIEGGSAFGDNFLITNTPINTSTESSSVTLYTGAFGAASVNDVNGVNVQGTSGPLYIDNTGGDDNVIIGSFAPGYGGTLANINGAVDVYGAGSTSLTIDDSGDTNYHYVNLTATSLVGLSPATIQWTPSAAATGGVTALTILGTAGGSTFNVINTPNLPATSATKLTTGTGSDIVAVDATTSQLFLFNSGGQDYVYIGGGTFAGINGNVYVSADGPTSLYVEDQADTTSHTATVTSNEVSGLSKGSVSWITGPRFPGFPAGVNYLEIDGSAAASTYDVYNTPAFSTYLDLGAGGWDVAYVEGTTGNLYVLNGVGAHAEVYALPGTVNGTINGLVDVYGAGDIYLLVEDFSTTSPRTATLTGNSLTGLSNGAIEWTPTSSPTGGVTSLEIYSSSYAANSTFNVTSIPSLYYGTALVGNSGTNTLIGPNTTNTWNITGANAGTLDTTLGFTGIQNLVGGTGVDTFKFTAAASQVANIDGGGAPAGQGNWLDYSAFPSAVTVNLATGKATGVTGTVHNIQNVFGGNFGNTLIGDAQGNILIGGAGPNTILGGSGASLLIGGKGNDNVTGGSGGDILIGGFTIYDQAHNEAALMSILAEWQSPNSYLTRVNQLTFGGGINGPNVLRLGTTVFDGSGTDSLTGGSHIVGALDWFFAGVGATIHNYETGERIN
jgi:hypothetical protein